MGYILHFTKALDSLLIENAFQLLFGDSVDHICPDRSRSECIDCNAILRYLFGGNLGEIFHCSLARGISGFSLPLQRCRDAGEVDDAAVLLFEHHFGNFSEKKECSIVVGFRCIFNCFIGGKKNMIHRSGTGIVKKHINPAELLFDIPYH